MTSSKAMVQAPHRRFRRRWGAGLVLGLLILSIGGALYGAHRVATSPCQAQATSEVPMPAQDAPPGLVVTAFVNSINAGDYETTRGVLAPAARTWYWDETGMFSPSYFGHLCEFRGFEITSVTPGNDLDREAAGSEQELVYVEASFDLRVKGQNQLDVDWPAGANGNDLAGPGVFTLVRDTPSQPWRVWEMKPA